jgi:hypothetical protein
MSHPEFSADRHITATGAVECFFEALTQAVAERAADVLTSRARPQLWLVGIDGLASYLGCSPRLARELRAKGCRLATLASACNFNATPSRDSLLSVSF